MSAIQVTLLLRTKAARMHLNLLLITAPPHTWKYCGYLRGIKQTIISWDVILDKVDAPICLIVCVCVCAAVRLFRIKVVEWNLNWQREQIIQDEIHLPSNTLNHSAQRSFSTSIDLSWNQKYRASASKKRRLESLGKALKRNKLKTNEPH